MSHNFIKSSDWPLTVKRFWHLCTQRFMSRFSNWKSLERALLQLLFLLENHMCNIKYKIFRCKAQWIVTKWTHHVATTQVKVCIASTRDLFHISPVIINTAKVKIIFHRRVLFHIFKHYINGITQHVLFCMSAFLCSRLVLWDSSMVV